MSLIFWRHCRSGVKSQRRALAAANTSPPLQPRPSSPDQAPACTASEPAAQAPTLLLCENDVGATDAAEQDMANQDSSAELRNAAAIQGLSIRAACITLFKLSHIVY